MEKNNKIILSATSEYEITFQSSSPQSSFCELNQTHSKNIIDFNNGVNLEDEEADGIIIPLKSQERFVIKTADCFPLCYIGTEYVGLVHAGWRGLAKEIHLDKKLQKIKPHTIISGPSICNNCFEVSPDFKAEFPNSSHLFKKTNEGLLFHIKSKLIEDFDSTFPYAKKVLSKICTKCDTRWHSFRRNKTPFRNYTVFKKEQN